MLYFTYSHIFFRQRSLRSMIYCKGNTINDESHFIETQCVEFTSAGLLAQLQTFSAVGTHVLGIR